MNDIVEMYLHEKHGLLIISTTNLSKIEGIASKAYTKTITKLKRRVKPVGIMFSEYYFYLTAFLEGKESFENPDDLFPTIYRIDRIRAFRVLDEHFVVPYKDRFQEGEFRKRVQFMYGGKLERIKFKYTGPSIEAVLDRLPTAQIVERGEAGWIVTAEVFGKGIDMWLGSQGELVELMEEASK